MQFTIEATKLVGALKKVKGAIAKRNSMPILGSVVIEAYADSVTFKATDLEVGIEAVESEALVQVEGAAVIPFEKTLRLARKFKGAVSFKLNDQNHVEIGCRELGSQTRIAGSPRSEYPALSEAPTRHYRVEAEPLRAALETVLHAVSKNETRYNLNGVYIDADSKPTPRVIATDGHRLALADAGPISLPWEGGVIVPWNGVANLVSLLKGEATVAVAIDPEGRKRSLWIAGSDWALAVRLTEGEFPNYEQVIPKAVNDTVIADPKEFSAALATALELAAERSRAVKLVLNGGLEFHTNNPDLGDSVVACPCERSQTEEWSLAFNGRYLADAVKAVCDTRVMLEFRDATSPVRISGAEPYPFAIVMPMRV